MKTIRKSYKNKNHEYERHRQRESNKENATRYNVYTINTTQIHTSKYIEQNQK